MSTYLITVEASGPTASAAHDALRRQLRYTAVVRYESLTNVVATDIQGRQVVTLIAAIVVSQ